MKLINPTKITTHKKFNFYFYLFLPFFFFTWLSLKEKKISELLILQYRLSGIFIYVSDHASAKLYTHNNNNRDRILGKFDRIPDIFDCV